MHRGKCRDAWGQAAMITAMIANANRDTKKRRKPFSPLEFNPYADDHKSASSGKMPITKATISMLMTLT